MTCINASKQWIIYDAKNQIFQEFTHVEFKDFINNRPEFSPIKFKDIKIWDRGKQQKVWIDGIINSEYFK